MNNNTLLFDFMKGEILEFPHDKEQEIIQDKHLEYKDSYVVFGRDYFNGHNVWFIKDITDTEISRVALEYKVLDYLARV